MFLLHFTDLLACLVYPYTCFFPLQLIGTPTTNGSFAQGDGVVLGEELGAELVDMDKVQLHPTGFIDPKNPSNPTKYLAPGRHAIS